MSTTVFRGGAVFCADAAGSWASAVAVVDGRVAAVGGDDEISPYLSGADDVVELAGRLLLPGFIDAHVHPVMGGIERMRCDLTPFATASDYAAEISSYASTHPDEAWIRGGGWSMPAFEGGTPTRFHLDAVCADRPIFLPNRDHHSAWVNSRALELAGVDSDTLDPSDGRIERDAAGVPTGALHEGAMALVESIVPADTVADQVEGLRVAQHYLHTLGVVGWQDAMVMVRDKPSAHDAYLEAERAGWLTARVSAALWWERDTAAADIDATVKRLVRVRDELAMLAGRYRADHVKVMVDGVVETFTAAMLEPYVGRCNGASHGRGISFLSADLLRAVVTAIDGAGMGVHFHALGDRAVRDALDSVAAARSANGTADRRHHLAHLQVVHPDDRARFRQLGVTANMQALWAALDEQMVDLTMPYLGTERVQLQYPFGDLLRDGAGLVMGSDWPVSTPDPFAALHVAVNRREAGASSDVPRLGPTQALPLAVALRAYTAGSAHITRLDDRSGTIAVGRDADLVLADRNPFDRPADEIGDTAVVSTYVHGELVHHAE